MGVIGIVAVLTIPNLNASTNDAEKVAKFKKTYAELAQAHDRATAVYGPVETWFTGISNNNYEALSAKYFDRLTEFMKVTKICGSNESAEVECVTSKTKNLLKRTNTRDAIDYRSAILASGSGFGVGIKFSNCIGAGDEFGLIPDHISIMCGSIHLDIDGPRKGKYTYGIDLFDLIITKEGIKPAKVSSSYLATSMGKCTREGYACGQWIMDHGNMDYLKADASEMCPNGKTLGYNASRGRVTSCK